MLHIRKAQSEDADLAYTWRNHPAIRRNSFDKNPIEYKTHIEWFSKSLIMKNRHILILLNKNRPIGFLRFDILDDIAKVNIYIAPEEQGNGYGTKGLEQGILWLKENIPDVKKLEAEVLPENVISQKTFTRSGFAIDHYVYRLNI